MSRLPLRAILTPQRLAAAPELAVLAVLDTALGAAIVALAVAWPELHDLDDTCPDDEPRAALGIVEHARGLAAAIQRYRLALASSNRREPDLPF